MRPKVFGRHKHTHGTLGVSLLAYGVGKRKLASDPSVVAEATERKRTKRKVTLRKDPLDE